MRRWLTFALGLGFSAFFAYIGFRGLNFNELFSTLGQIQVAWLALAVIVYFVAIYVLTWRWYFLLRPLKTIPVNQTLYPIVMIGYMANNIYPARLGEFIRAYILRRNTGIPYPPSLATILVERIFDGLVMLAFIFSALLFVSFDEPVLERLIQFTTPLFFGALIVFTGFALRPDLAERVYSGIIGRFSPPPLRPRLLDLAGRFMEGLSALRQPRLLGLTWFSSLASWLIEASTYWIVLQAFEFRVSFWVLMLVIGLANLTTILPSTPGYVGTFHGVTVLTLGAFGVAGESAGAYAIVMHMVLWLPVTLVGGVMLYRQGLGWRDLSRAAQIKEQTASEITDDRATNAQATDESEALS